nr:hypothetical protein [Chroococcidiopsis cubana]
MNKIQQPDEATKLINELGWRDYWQRLYVKLGNGIWEDREEYKTGYTTKEYAPNYQKISPQGRQG